MKAKPYSNQDGSTLICALCTILIISLIGANVLLNCTTRYNVSSKQVKGWKEALYAAEGGGDIAFSEVRKPYAIPSSTAFLPSNGWKATAGPSYTSYIRTDGQPYSFGQNNSLSVQVTVDQLTATLPGQGQYYYRIRSQGTATLLGLPRVGMDDRMDSVTRGDSLLRKIDFKYDHFKAKYGDGDSTPGTIKIQTVQYPQITRRIETIAIPQLASFTGALKVGNAFNGPGAAGLIDSFDSKNGAYPGRSIAANPVPPTDPKYKYYIDSRNGDVSVGTASFSEIGPIYGNVTTNGGNVTSSSTNISGTIDNSVPFTIPPLVIPDTGVATGFNPPPTGSGTTLDLPTLLSTLPAGTGTTSLAPAKYVYSSLTSGLTINGLLGTDKTLPSYNKPIETYVTIVVGSAGSTTGDVGNITIGAGVNAKIYFTGSLNVSANGLVNNNVDGATGVYMPDGVTSSNDYSRAGHLQFYGISPTDGTQQTIAITPPGSVHATVYAPSGNISLTGNANWVGAIVGRSFTVNGNGGGNTGFHYDKEIAGDGVVTDYQIASYIEDVR
jgi:hypothetical protein